MSKLIKFIYSLFGEKTLLSLKSITENKLEIINKHTNKMKIIDHLKNNKFCFSKYEFNELIFEKINICHLKNLETILAIDGNNPIVHVIDSKFDWINEMNDHILCDFEFKDIINICENNGSGDSCTAFVDLFMYYICDYNELISKLKNKKIKIYNVETNEQQYAKIRNREILFFKNKKSKTPNYSKKIKYFNLKENIIPIF